MSTYHLFRVSHSIEQLHTLPRPADSLSHAEVADQLASVCDHAGWQPSVVVGCTGGKTQHESALGVTVSPDWAPELPEGWLYVLALHYTVPRGGTWLSRHPRLFHGVAPADGYGIPLGEIVFNKRGNQAGRQPIGPQIRDALEDVRLAISKYHERLFLLRGWKMSRNECERTLLETARARIMPSSRVLTVMDDALAGQMETTFWDTLQAFARTVRMNRPVPQQMKQALSFVHMVERLGVAA